MIGCAARASGARRRRGRGGGASHSSKIATGLSPGAASSMGTTSSSNTPSSGSGRRRPRSAFLVEGARGSCAIRVTRGRAEPGLGRGDGDRAARTVGREEPHLAIGHVAAGHGRSSRWRKHPSTSADRDHPAPPPAAGADTTGPGSPFGPGPVVPSHPDCRAALTLFVAPQQPRPSPALAAPMTCERPDPGPVVLAGQARERVTSSSCARLPGRPRARL